jgi:3-oxoacyl-[acyl-carrier-protein] synthase III
MTSIRAIAGVLPETKVTNEDLARENPSWRMELIAEITGIHSRHVAAEEETSFDLSARACDELLARPDVEAGEIDALVCCAQEPDYLGIPNACLLHEHLGLDDGVLAFDFALGCSGFVYGLAITDGLIRSGAASNALLITADTPTKHLNPRDRATRVLLGDGAAATYIAGTEAEGGGRLVASELCTRGGGFEHAYIPAGGARRPADLETRHERTDPSGNVRTAEEMHMDGTALWSFVSSTIPGHVETFLAKHSLSLDDIDLWVFHQASAMILKSLAKALAIPPEKLFLHLKDVGNLSSASIPFALQAALEQGAIQPGSRVLLSAFGAGFSYGSAILQY